MDARYELVKVMYDAGHISNLRDIFKFVPKTTVALDARIAIDAFNLLLDHPDRWQIKKLFEIGVNCGLNEQEMMELLMNSYEQKKKKI